MNDFVRGPQTADCTKVQPAVIGSSGQVLQLASSIYLRFVQVSLYYQIYLMHLLEYIEIVG